MVDQSAAPEPTTTVAAAASTMRALRGNSFGTVVMLLVQFVLGMWVNLYGQLPASDAGANPATGIGRAISDGPVGLSIHAVLGLLLIASAIAALIRAIRVREAVLITAAAVGLAAMVTAALSGARFVGHGDNGSSISMAVAAAVAIGAYALILFTSSANTRPPDRY